MTSRPSKTIAWGKDWSVGLRVWIDREGHAVLGQGRAELLAGIDRWHSISAAAREMGMSYRRAWLLVQAVNEAAGEPFVEAAVGGKQGGGARLTERGRTAVAMFTELHRELRSAAATTLPKLLQVTPDTTTLLHLAAAISLQEVVGQLLTEYALHKPATTVRAIFGASNELAEHLLSGAPGDLFLSADGSHLDALEAAGLADPRSRRTLARNGLAVVAAGGKTFSIRKPADLLETPFKHIALADAACPLGKCSKAYLEHLGLYEKLLPRAVHVDNSRGVLSALHSGRADVGLAFTSDTVLGGDCQILLRARPQQASVEYAGAALRSGHEADARALLDFISSPTAWSCFRHCGFQPVAKD
jgi:molybdenum ABC transporter molybdate-binding protein